MRTLWRLVRRVDDVAEVLIFDVLLGTRGGRRVLAALAAGAACAVWLASGALFAPDERLPFERVDSRPLIDDATWERVSPELAAAADTLVIPAAQRAAIAAEVARRDPELERAHNLLYQDGWKFAGVPRFPNVRDLATLFIVRGMLRAEREARDERAMLDWVVATRVGLAVATRRTHPPTMLQGRFSTRIQLLAFKAIKKHIDGKKVSTMQEIVLRQGLDFQRAQHAGLPRLIEGERVFRAGVLRQTIERGLAIDRMAPLSMRMLQPATRAGRVDFMIRLRDALAAYDRKPERPDEPSRLDHLRALFSRERAVDHVARTIARHLDTDKVVTGLFTAELDGLVKYIDDRCNPLDLEGI